MSEQPRRPLDQQIQTNIDDIQQLLSRIQSMKSVRKVIKQCDKHMRQEQDQQASSSLIWQYDPSLDYQFQPYAGQCGYVGQEGLMGVEVETRHGWVQEYLRQGGVRVYGRVAGVKVGVRGLGEGSLLYGRGENGQVQGQVGIGQFNAENETVYVEFTANRYRYQLGSSLVKIEVQEKENVVLRINNSQCEQSQAIRRLIVFKLSPVQPQEQSQQSLLSSRTRSLYSSKAEQGFYQHHDFTQNLQLQPGAYILMPFSATSLTLYTTKKHNLQVVPEQNRKQFQQLNLMLQGFHECHPDKMSAEFIRQTDLNKGIVIEIYRNVYDNEICFQDINKGNKPEDKRLMFRSLYSKRYQSYRLRKGEVIVQFYELTAKPAILYQPHKKVIVDKDQDYQAKTIHSILK